jgi:hypothetical protein
MRGKILLIVRRLHLYLSVFFAPLLLLFIITGWAQTMDFDHSSTLMRRLSTVHKNDYFPSSATSSADHHGSRPREFGDADRREGGPKTGVPTWPMKWLVSAMCVSLIISISLGLVLAFTMVRNRTPVWIALILGIATPVALLTAAHFW